MMDKYSRWFIIVSVVYLLIGTFMGALMAFHVLDTTFRYLHIHLNLFGFMSMMVFGVAYHILPRFMGKTVNWPWLIPYHFYFVNIGLIGMMHSYRGGYLGQSSQTAIIFFGIFSFISFLGVVFFAVNLIPVVMLSRKKAVPEAPAVKSETVKPPAPVKEETVITGDMKIGEILEKKPETLNLFIAAGFKGLEKPETRKAFGEKLVLKTACQIRSIDLGGLLKKLNGPIGSDEAAAAPAVTPPEKPQNELSIKRGELITLKTPVGEMVQVYPETKKVLEDNYGGECFSCPGMAIETIEQTANMHNKKPEDILDQINSIVKEVLD